MATPDPFPQTLFHKHQGPQAPALTAYTNIWQLVLSFLGAFIPLVKNLGNIPKGWPVSPGHLSFLAGFAFSEP